MKRNPRTYSIHRKAIVLIVATVLATAGMAKATELDPSHAVYNTLLKHFVTDGRVDYEGLKADPNALEDYLEILAAVTEATFNRWAPSEQLALLINLYNAATLKLIVDHYPVKSIKDIGGLFKGPWDQPVVGLFGRTITLDNLEHDIIRKKYSEPRIHLALVCAARSCPPLRSEAYVADKLDAQLDDQARRFLASAAGLRIDRERNRIYLSSIFKWYGEDFIAGFSPPNGYSGLGKTERAVANFCRGYLSPQDGDYLKSGGYDIKYLDYDWSLNEK